MTEDRKDGNGDMDSKQPKSRKTLTLKPSQGGRKPLGVGSSSTYGVSGSSSRTKHNSRTGTVVVVTKSKGAGRSGNEGQNTKNLVFDDPEVKRKLDILKKASDKRRAPKPDLSSNDQPQEQEIDNMSKDVSVDSQFAEESAKDKDIIVSADVKSSASNAGGAQESSKDDSLTDPKGNPALSDDVALSYGSMEGFERAGANKLRNLNALGRKKPKKDAKDDKEAVQDTKKTHGGSDASAFSRSAPEKKPDFKGKKASGLDGERGKFFEDEVEEQKSYKKRSNRNKSHRNTGKEGDLSITQLLNVEDDSGEVGYKPRGIRSILAYKNKGKATKKVKRERMIKHVSIYEGITVQEISSLMSEKVGDVIKKLMSLGIMATINQSLDIETAEILVGEMGHTHSVDSSSNLEEFIVDEIRKDKDDEGYTFVKRSPIVTIMGHVDHGKTSLLDAYRKSKVVEGEAGGITQHIAAYQVQYNNHKVTFLDTPGHAAFTAMRLRGAMVTDIVVIIVAADDGVMEQTVEAINHAKAAKVPIIVAINKIDKPEANVEKVKNQLLSHNLIPEDMGGDVMVVPVSAVKNLHLDDLLDAILLQAELLDLDVQGDRPSVGSVVEARMERQQGIKSTLLIKKGTLTIGDVIVAGKSWGRIKNIYNDVGKAIKSATPSMPVEVVGLNTPPVAGDEFLVVQNEKQARDIVEYRIENENKTSAANRPSATLENLMKSMDGKRVRQLNVLIKADVHGSMEAIAASLQQIETDEVKVNIIHQAVGGITESDITLARASDAIVIGFNVRAPLGVVQIAKTHDIEIRYYSIIYQLIDDVKMAASGLLDPIQKEEVTGYAEIRDVFNLSKYGKVAGCYITNGIINRDSKLRVIRDDIVIYTGDVKALKRFKDDVKEVKSGFECGISLEKFDDIKVGDKFEAFTITEEKRTL